MDAPEIVLALERLGITCMSSVRFQSPVMRANDGILGFVLRHRYPAVITRSEFLLPSRPLMFVPVGRWLAILMKMFNDGSAPSGRRFG
jgi:hypothetical protein